MPRFPSDRTLLGVPDWDEDEKIASEMMVEEMEMSDDNEDDNPDKLPKMELLRRRFRRVLKKVKDVNTHHHTKKACKKENRPGCR